MADAEPFATADQLRSMELRFRLEQLGSFVSIAADLGRHKSKISHMVSRGVIDEDLIPKMVRIATRRNARHPTGRRLTADDFIVHEDRRQWWLVHALLS